MKKFLVSDEATKFAIKFEKTLNYNDEQNFSETWKETCERELKTLLTLKKIRTKNL